MAHVAVVIDEVSDRRDRFVANVRTLFAALEGATVREERDGDFACVWAAGPHAPVDVHRDAGGCAVFIGYGIAQDGRRVSARDLRTDWLEASGRPELHDGYHVGVAWSPGRGLVAGVDPLGMFPLHWASPGAGPTGPLVAASTPEALRCHPLFTARIDRRALAGILLVHGPLLDRPVLAGTRRLGSGNLLRWSLPGGAAEEEGYRLVGASPPEGESTAGAQERIRHEFLAAVRRHAPSDGAASILLSGGLDSRLVAAGLTHLGIPARAIILGREDDFEVRAGAAVARRLGMPCEVVATEALDGSFPGRTRQHVRFGHLVSAPGADDFAEGVANATASSRYLWSGIVYDWTFEPLSYADGYDITKREWRLDGLATYMNRWGVPAGRLPSMLGVDGPDLYDGILADLQMACLRGVDRPEIGASRIRWDQRVRNHVATAIHRVTFHSWPLLPATDRRFFEATFGLPPTAYADRVLERAVLRSIRPDLGVVPLDTNSFRFEPPDRGMTGLGRVAASARGRLRRLYWTVIRRQDPRRYERLFNVDHPRWMAVRREVEPLRRLLHRHLDRRAVDSLLPPPGVRTGFKNPVNSGGAVRLLLGLALLVEQLDRPPTPPP